MKTLCLLLFMMKSMHVSAQAPFLIDFSSPQELHYWNRVNDSVMGGLSESNLRLKDKVAFFEGELSLKNNGGFASIRRVGPTSLHANQGPIKVHFKGDGRTYQFRLRTTQGFDGMAYVATFATQIDSWQTLDFSEEDFVAQYRGLRVVDAPDVSFSHVKQIGFMLADKQSGKFQLAIKSMRQ